MAKPKRTEAQRQDDLRELAKMYLAGVPQSEMAARFKVSQPQVSYDLASIRRAWVKEAAIDFGERQSLELARVDRNERELLAAWERSKEAAAAARKAGKAGNGKAGKAADLDPGQDGDPRYMALILKCTDQRVQMLRLDAQITRVDEQETQDEYDLSGLTDDEIKTFHSLLRKIKRSPGINSPNGEGTAGPIPGSTRLIREVKDAKDTP